MPTMKKVVLTLCCLLVVVLSHAQGEKATFVSPLGVPLLLSANFGELRANHFHSGLDFKTQGRTGLNVYAADDGYVSRIAVSPWGYGRRYISIILRATLLYMPTSISLPLL